MEKYLEGILERGERIGLTGAELRIWILERIEETRELQALKTRQQEYRNTIELYMRDEEIKALKGELKQLTEEKMTLDKRTEEREQRNGRERKISNEVIKALKEELKSLKEEKIKLEKAQTEILQKIKEDKKDATDGREQKIKDEEIINALREQLKILEEEKMDFEKTHKTVINNMQKELMSKEMERLELEKTHALMTKKMKKEITDVTEESENIEKAKDTTIQNLNDRLMNLMEEKADLKTTLGSTIEGLEDELIAVKDKNETLDRRENDINEGQTKLISNLKDEEAAVEVKQYIRTENRQELFTEEGEKKSTIEHKCDTIEELPNKTGRKGKSEQTNIIETEKNRETTYAKKKKCFRCGSENHLIRYRIEENNLWESHRRINPCHICKKTGHKAMECWFKDQVDGERRCFRCRSPDHVVKFCSQPNKTSVSPGTTGMEPEMRRGIQGQYKRHRAKEDQAMRILLAASSVLSSLQHFGVSFPERHFRRGGGFGESSTSTDTPVTVVQMQDTDKSSNG